MFFFYFLLYLQYVDIKVRLGLRIKWTINSDAPCLIDPRFKWRFSQTIRKKIVSLFRCFTMGTLKGWFIMHGGLSSIA